MVKIYLAGPMTGIPQFNIPAFDAAAANLRARGYDVVSPAELDDPRIRELELASVDGDLAMLDVALTLRGLGRGTHGEFLARDVKLIADGGIEGIVVLPGWEDSKGAQLETFVARQCGLPVFEYDEEPGSLERVWGHELAAVHAHDVRDRTHFIDSFVNDPGVAPVEDDEDYCLPCDGPCEYVWDEDEDEGRDAVTEAEDDELLADATEVRDRYMGHFADGGVVVSSLEEFASIFAPATEGPVITPTIKLDGRVIAEEVCDFVPRELRYKTGPEEVRVIDPETGGEKGMKQAQLGALDPLALLEVAKVAGFGAGKYARFNFAKGYAWSLSFDALQRHLLQWAAGEEVDEESGLSHLGHAAWHCLALLTFVLRERGTDDRLHRTLEAA